MDRLKTRPIATPPLELFGCLRAAALPLKLLTP
jgi:hypothetical protein